MITAEELVLEVDNTEESNSFKLGIVTDLFENETAKIQFDGEETPSEKQYAYLSSYIPTIGDRVLLGVLGGTYIILGKVNYNVSPDTEEEIDRYLFDLKKVIMEKGLSIIGNTDIEGDLSVSGKLTTSELDLQGGLNINGDIGATNVTATKVQAGRSYIEDTKVVTPLISAASSRISTLNHTGSQLAFFGTSLKQKRTVQSINVSTTLTLEVLRNKINDLLYALDYYGLIND